MTIAIMDLWIRRRCRFGTVNRLRHRHPFVFIDNIPENGDQVVQPVNVIQIEFLARRIRVHVSEINHPDTQPTISPLQDRLHVRSGAVWSVVLRLEVVCDISGIVRDKNGA